MRHIVGATLLAALFACGEETPVTQPPEIQANSTSHARYKIDKYPSLGGTLSRGMAISDRGWVAGWSNHPDGSREAALWRRQGIKPLGTLGGPSSTVPWPGLNEDGMVVGISQTDEVDPLDEDWACEFGGFLPETTNLICRGFVWENGRMWELPTLGGNHGFAADVNQRGQIVGWAETPVHDATCDQTTKQRLRFRAVIWEQRQEQKGRFRKQQLRPLGDDATSAATAINNEGQAVGISGDCDQGVGRFSAIHAVIWDRNGNPTEIPNLGGTTWHTPMDINEKGHVVGFSNPPEPGDPGEFVSQAFLWINGSAIAKNLGTLDDDPLSEAFAINNRNQVVGISFGGATSPRAFIWEKGELQDLNDLVDISPDTLLSAQDINDEGQITGRLKDAATGEQVTFVATPIRSSP